MSRKADLDPPLGKPGGPCHVIRRIRDEVEDLQEEDTLVRQVEHNKDLTNPDAAKVYDLEAEAGVGQFKQMIIGPHCQYRMDLRGITVPDVRAVLGNFLKQLNDWKAQKSYEYQDHAMALSRGEPIEWFDRKTGLTVIFKGEGAWQVKLITTYPKGKPDPKVKPGQCVVAYRTPDLSGFQTYVKYPQPGMEPNVPAGAFDGADERAADAEKQQVLPSPPWTRSKPTGKPHFNGPPGSADALDGKPLSTDRARTLGKPGEDEHPWVDNSTGYHQVRPNMSASVKGPAFPGANRQQEQYGKAKKYYEKYYRKNKSKIQQKVKRWEKKNEHSTAFKKDKARRRKYPERYERKNQGVADPAERSKEWREEHKGYKKATEGMGLFAAYHRQRRQRGVARTKTHRNYVKNRAKNIQRSRQRYRRMKNNPTFKRRQHVRQQHPERFKRRNAGLLTAPEIAFVIGQGLHLGYVHGVSPMTGLVTYHYEDVAGSFSRFRSAPVDEFLDNVAFLSDADIDSMFRLLDNELGVGGYEDPDEGPDDEPDETDVETDTVQNLVYDGEDLPPRRTPGSPNEYVYGQVDMELVAKVAWLYEKRPPEMDPETVFDRASPPPRGPGHKPTLPDFDGGTVEGNPGSAKVIPSGHGFQNKEAARISEILDKTSPVVHGTSRNVTIKLRRVDTQNLMWLFDVPGSQGTYKVRVKALPTKGSTAIDKADVQVSCSCPFWQWQGPEHWAKKNGYLYGKPAGTASRPDEKDPDSKHWACKHVLAVLHRVRTFVSPAGKPQGRFASVHYLADTLDTGGAVVPDFKFAAVRVAARYLEGRRI